MNIIWLNNTINRILQVYHIGDNDEHYLYVFLVGHPGKVHLIPGLPHYQIRKFPICDYDIPLLHVHILHNFPPMSHS